MKLLLCNVYASRSLRSLFLGYIVFSDIHSNDNNKEDPVEFLECKISPHYNVIKLASNYDFVSLSIADRNYQ